MERTIYLNHLSISSPMLRQKNTSEMYVRLLFFIVLSTVCVPATYGEGNDHVPPNGWEAYQWRNPGGWEKVNVAANGLPPDKKSVNAAKKVQEILDGYSDQRVNLHFPKGTYYFQSTLSINRGNVVISGEGPDSTTFIIDAPSDKRTKIAFTGGEKGPELEITQPIERGDDRISVADTSQVSAGDFLYVYKEVEVKGKTRSAGQLVQVTKTRSNVLDLDMEIGLNMDKPRAVKRRLLKHVGFTNLHVERARTAPNHTRNLHVNGAYNFFVKQVDVEDVITGGIYVTMSRNGVVKSNTLHDTIGKVVGSRGDGIMLHGGATNVNVTNNRAWNLRHHYWLGAANHCVIAYNRAEEKYQAYGDYGQHHGMLGHNNLFEGNFGNEIFTDGGDGPWHSPTWYVTFFRNRARTKIGSGNKRTNYDSILANEILKGDGIKAAGSSSFVGVNIVDGEMKWGDMKKGGNIPASLVYDKKPDHVQALPLYGPGAPEDRKPVPDERIDGQPNQGTENAKQRGDEKSHDRTGAVERFDPVVRNIQGWTVHVDPALIDGKHKKIGRRALAVLHDHLRRIRILVKDEPLKKLKQTEIWIEQDHPALEAIQYHPSVDWLKQNGHDPRLAKKVHITRAKTLLSRHQMVKQPWVVLHELAHAYHDQYLGFDDSRIKKAYRAAKEAGIYEKVLLYTGKMVRHYGLTDHKEYFAEGTEAYFARNDFYPFVRAELKEHDPRLHELLKEIWGPVQ